MRNFLQKSAGGVRPCVRLSRVAGLQHVTAADAASARCVKRSNDSGPRQRRIQKSPDQSRCVWRYKDVALSIKQRAAVIDRYGELKRRAAEFKPTSDEAAKLGKEIASWYDDEPADEAFVAAGNSYTVQIGQKAIERRITDMPRVLTIVGKSRFMQLCGFPLAAVDQHIAATQIPDVLSSERSGDRTVKAVAKVTPINRKAA